MVMKRILSILCGILACMASYAQYVPPVMKDTTKARAFKNIDYKVEMQGSFSNTKTPLWLNANKHGLSSLEATNGYIRLPLIVLYRLMKNENGV